ncbi:MAG: AMP phosphorylase, partial [Candidatus Altiarchaeales archaeon]|nr:AMP phosphorylase [Candidatus Altiarchaeales archaeon]
KPTGRPVSVHFIKKKMDGSPLSEGELYSVIQDIASNNLTATELSAFVTAGYIRGYCMDEVVALTKAMVETGQKIDFGDDIVDKHCIGGVAGNRTSMLIVPIIAAAGLTIPKTSSRAITSPSGTADTMEVLAEVEFGIDELKEIVNEINSCIIWGGSVNLAPADDKIIRVEYPLSMDAEGHLLASVMAKKVSVGSDYLLIDIPIGKGAKIEDTEKANDLAHKFISLGDNLGISVECVVTDGGSPIGSGIGPGLEARDVLLALENKGPVDLIDKSVELAGNILELSKKIEKGKGRALAESILRSGKAKEKMREIIEAQNGDPDITPEDIQVGEKQQTIEAKNKGKIRYIDNKLISRIARAAGAPRDNGAGIYMHITVGDSVKVGDPLFTLYSKSGSRLKDSVELTEELIPVRVGSIISYLLE